MTRDEASGLELELVRDFDAPPEVVFKAWTNRDALKVWMGPESRTCPNTEINPVVEGAYRFPMEAEDGSIATVVGHFTRIEPPRFLAFSWSWMQEDGSIGRPMHVSLEFEKLDGDKTRMKMLHVNLMDTTARDNHQEGWVGCFNCLDRYLDK
ncbi:MAG: SRPBCC domain-containing protein [Sneathiella sp.]